MKISQDIIEQIISGNLSVIRIESRQPNPEEMALLAFAIRHPDCGLSELHLKNTGLTTASIQPLYDALKMNRSLRILDLSNNEIGTDDTGALGEMLANNNTIKEIDLSHCKLTTRTIENIIECSVESMDLSDNHIGLSSLVGFAFDVQSLQKLHITSVESNASEHYTVRAINSYLSLRNRRGEPFDAEEMDQYIFHFWDVLKVNLPSSSTQSSSKPRLNVVLLKRLLNQVGHHEIKDLSANQFLISPKNEGFQFEPIYLAMIDWMDKFTRSVENWSITTERAIILAKGFLALNWHLFGDGRFNYFANKNVISMLCTCLAETVAKLTGDAVVQLLAPSVESVISVNGFDLKEETEDSPGKFMPWHFAFVRRASAYEGGDLACNTLIPIEPVFSWTRNNAHAFFNLDDLPFDFTQSQRSTLRSSAGRYSEQLYDELEQAYVDDKMNTIPAVRHELYLLADKLHNGSVLGRDNNASDSIADNLQIGDAILEFYMFWKTLSNETYSQIKDLPAGFMGDRPLESYLLVLFNGDYRCYLTAEERSRVQQEELDSCVFSLSSVLRLFLHRHQQLLSQSTRQSLQWTFQQLLDHLRNRNLPSQWSGWDMAIMQTPGVVKLIADFGWQRISSPAEQVLYGLHLWQEMAAKDRYSHTQRLRWVDFFDPAIMRAIGIYDEERLHLLAAETLRITSLQVEINPFVFENIIIQVPVNSLYGFFKHLASLSAKNCLAFFEHNLRSFDILRYILKQIQPAERWPLVAIPGMSFFTKPFTDWDDSPAPPDAVFELLMLFKQDERVALLSQCNTQSMRRLFLDIPVCSKGLLSREEARVFALMVLQDEQAPLPLRQTAILDSFPETERRSLFDKFFLDILRETLKSRRSFEKGLSLTNILSRLPLNEQLSVFDGFLNDGHCMDGMIGMHRAGFRKLWNQTMLGRSLEEQIQRALHCYNTLVSSDRYFSLPRLISLFFPESAARFLTAWRSDIQHRLGQASQTFNSTEKFKQQLLVLPGSCLSTFALLCGRELIKNNAAYIDFFSGVNTKEFYQLQILWPFLSADMISEMGKAYVNSCEERAENTAQYERTLLTGEEWLAQQQIMIDTVTCPLAALEAILNAWLPAADKYVAMRYRKDAEYDAITMEWRDSMLQFIQNNTEALSNPVTCLIFLTNEIICIRRMIRIELASPLLVLQRHIVQSFLQQPTLQRVLNDFFNMENVSSKPIISSSLSNTFFASKPGTSEAPLALYSPEPVD